MKALILEKPAPITKRPLRLSEVPKPPPNANKILIRVEACGVCRTDLHVCEGDLESRRSPVIPGHQVVGRVVESGTGAEIKAGERVGVAWLHRTCGSCRFCQTGKENLCDKSDFTGWTVDGGFAEYMLADPSFVYPIPEKLSSEHAAPLLCAGIIGYRALRLTGVEDWEGSRIGIYGFGAAGHVAIQIARHRGAEVYVATRDRDKHQKLAAELGAAWIGDTFDTPPERLDAGIIFAPAGEIVPPALAALEKGGTLVLGGIHMSPIPEFRYELLYGERSMRSVANNTREDGKDFFNEAAEAEVRTHISRYGLEEANNALIDLKQDAVRGAAVLIVE